MDLTNPSFTKALFHPDDRSNALFPSQLSSSFTISFFYLHSSITSTVNKLLLEQFHSLVGFPEPSDFGVSQGFLFDLPISIQSLSTEIQNVTLSFSSSLDSSEILSCSIFFSLPHLKLQVVFLTSHCECLTASSSITQQKRPSNPLLKECHC